MTSEAAATLTALLAQWRKAPHSVLADQIVALGAQLPAPATLEWETTVGDEAVSTLLAALLTRNSKVARERVAAVTTWPADPRVERWVAGLYVEPPFTSSGSRPMWTQLLVIASKTQDAKAIALLKKARAQLEGRTEAWQEHLRAQLDRALHAIGERAPREVPLTAKQLTSFAEMDAARASQKKRTLPPHEVAGRLEAVLANPGDDAARLVLADALLENGDPRGELITLQFKPTLSPSAQRRVTALIKKSREALLGPLTKVLKPNVEFKKGFLWAGAVTQSSVSSVRIAVEKSVGHPLWSTLERLEGPGDEAISTHPVMKSLRELINTSVPFATLAAMPALEVIKTNAAVIDRTRFGANAFQSLRDFSLRLSVAEASVLMASALARRLDRLEMSIVVDGPHEFSSKPAIELISLLRGFACRDVTFRLLRGFFGGVVCELRFTRDEAGALTVSTFACGNGPRGHGEASAVQDLKAALEVVDTLSPVSLVFDSGLVDAKNLDEARVIVTKHGGRW